MKKIVLLALISFTSAFQISKGQNLYFPPLSSAANWETISPTSLGWCQNRIDSLYTFLQQQDTKGFIVLKDGKIVLEKYFGTFTTDSLWYWASAGKTITSFLVGKAQEENYLSINDSSSKYLGAGWTNCTLAQEGKIKIRNQLTMTSGLDDGTADSYCTLDTCLDYLADAGTRWAYHNAPYTLLESVITAATGTSINNYTQNKLTLKTGISGIWAFSGYNNVFFSKIRSMARFGLLMQNNCIWNTDTLLYDAAYINQMTNTSQNLNLSYGYLWWLNGKSSFMAPSTQFVFPGSYAPAAPSDMFAGLGKNGQIVSVSKSAGLVVIRMGNQVGNTEVTTQLCNSIWEKLNAAICNLTYLNETSSNQNSISIFPNPANSVINVALPSDESFQIEILNPIGETIFKLVNQNKIDISNFTNGLYLISVKQGQNIYYKKIIKR
ncbi:serine hydrolase [Aurantibacillus circumpalustris]|uniref:serine hydrolase n=1 Tax=Aurantibacillus circumpalustris TaxID=3036359 RepID=UPI00295BBF55|nr:serine hydrolase [Aurantibacillus circumpalustris]